MNRRVTIPGGADAIQALQLFVHLANAKGITLLHDKGCLCPDGFPLPRCTCQHIELIVPDKHQPIEIEHRIA